jgi:PAS domain S-box-containing protein
MSEKAKIVIVEDEAIIALTLTAALTRLGYSVGAHFSTGEDLIEYLDMLPDNYLPDLLLMDITLAGKLDGIETVNIVKSKHDIPVIYLTAFSNETIIKKAKVSEPYAYILKPFNERELHISIEIALYKFKSELKIKKSEQQFRDLFNAVDSLFYCTDLEGKLELISPSVKHILGYEPEYLIGKKTTEFYGNVEDRNKLNTFLAEKGYVNGFEGQLKRSDGTIIDVSGDIKYLRNDKGEPTGICGIVRDISDLKKSESNARNYLRAIEQSNEIIVITDERGTIQFANTKTEQITGYSAKELMGQTPRLFKSGILSNTFYSRIWDQLLQGHVVESIFPNRTKSGRIYYEEKVITPIRNREGKINLFISTGRDITDKIKTRRRMELLNHNSKLKETEANKNIILSFIQGQEEERKRVSTEIHDGLCQMLSIAKMSLSQKGTRKKDLASSNLNELIDASIIEAKRIANNLSPAVLTDFGLASGIKKLVQISGLNTKIKIISRIPDVILRLPMDAELALFRISQEAIANSIKHSGCKYIMIRLYFSDEYIILNIIDNGKGFKKKTIYTPGSGLGMSNMKQRSKIIGATITVNSKTNKYTSITVKYRLTPAL